MRSSIPVRLSEALREGLVELSADNLSAGIRACIILTRYHEGYDVSQLKPDAEKLIGEPITQALKRSLMAIILDQPPATVRDGVQETGGRGQGLDDRDQVVGTRKPEADVPTSAPETGETPAPTGGDDPFASLGEDV